MTINHLTKLETPEDFIQFYYNQIKNSLNINDININRLGFIGFFFELMGVMQYDIKNYYDTLFAEAFPITASNNENLIYHSHVYGYEPKLANPSTVQGVFKFNFSRFPLIPYDITRREVLVSDSEYSINFKLNDINYILDSDYKIIFERLDSSASFRINCEIKSKDGYQVFPILQLNPTVKIVDLKQYQKFEETFSIPTYNYNSYYQLILKISDFLYEIEVWVKEKNTSEFIKYEVRYTKSFALQDEKIVFIKITPKNELILELGSGINGKYIPNSNIKVVYKTTKGDVGNISTNTIIPSGKIRILDFISNSSITNNSTFSFNSTSNMFLQLLVTGSYGGENAEIDKLLRNNLIKYIQSRNNLVSETDFKNQIVSYFDVCEILFKKTDIVENVIYCYIPLYDRLLNPVKTLTSSIKLIEFDPDSNKSPELRENNILIYEPLIKIEGVDFISPFLYMYDKLTRLYKGFFVIEKNVVNYSNKIIHNDIGVDVSLSLFIEIEFKGKSSVITVKSYSDITAYKFKLNSQTLSFSNKSMIPSGNSFWIMYDNGLIENDTNMTVSVYKDIVTETKTIQETLIMMFDFYNVRSVYSFANIIRLKPVIIDKEKYIVNLPLIEKSKYYSEKAYYQDKILSNISKLTISQNRMLSDEVQLRFLNTFYIDTKFVKDLILQYSLTGSLLPVRSWYLPFKLEVYLDFSKDLILSKSKNVTDEADNIIENISNYLLNNQTGLNVQFYKTKIIDIIHNNEFIKNAKVILKDSQNTEIPDSNFENNNNQYFIEHLNKADYLHYSPIYYWFDLNNITCVSKAYD